MATELREYRPGSHHAADLTLVGYDVEATDGPLGRVEQDAGDHLLVDTRPWVPGAPVPVPIGTVARVDHLELVVHLDCPRARIRLAPPSAAVELTGGGPAASAVRASRCGARPGS
ncbi:PRC-barrel domain containing protein [Kitasatospora purpeofusca]|uniref:PRC-barrel domain containing protein n=1 Tax=Kitasatospora purpeofusca TaxID=67352 RepID=UPI000B1E0643